MTTPNLNFNIPVPGTDIGTWGPLTNANATALDALLSGGAVIPAINAKKIEGVIYADQYGTIAAALAALPSGRGTVYVPNGYVENITYGISLAEQRLIIDPGATITFGTNGQIVVSDNGVLDAKGCTLTTSWTAGNCIQINGGFARVDIARIVGPGSGTGNGLCFDGCSFATAIVGVISGFGGIGVLFNCVGVASICDNNYGMFGHISNNAVAGIMFTNRHSITDSEVQNNVVYAGLVDGPGAIIQFGDSGTYNAPQGSAQGNQVFGFGDSGGSSSPSVLFLNCSYNYFTGQCNPGSGGSFVATNSFFNTINCPTATALQIAAAPGQIWSGLGGLGITGRIATLGSIPTAGIFGVPGIFSQVASSGLTANYNAGTAKTVYTPPSAAGIVRVDFSSAITQAATSSSTMPSLTLGWTDAGGIARTKVIVATSATNTTAVEADGSTVIYTNASTPVTVTSAGYASSGATVMKYDLSVTVEAL